MGLISALLVQLKQASLLQYYLLCYLYIYIYINTLMCISLIKRFAAVRHISWRIRDIV